MARDVERQDDFLIVNINVIKGEALSSLRMWAPLTCWSALLGLLMIFAPAVWSQEPEEGNRIKVAQLDWCPEVCPGQEKPGYIVEILKEAFADSEFQLEFSTLPWSRALASTLGGNTDAVIAPAKIEAPKLVYPNEPVGMQRACFYTLATSNWVYDGSSSLKDKKIGLPSDMSLEEIHDYVMDNRHQFYFQSITARYLGLSINMLAARRLDAFAFTENAVIHQLQESSLDGTIRQAGCVSATPVYMAFTPVGGQRNLREKAIRFFDSRMQALKDNGKLSAILQRYGVPDWSKGF